MNEFFKFIFNPDIVEQQLRTEWIKLYDYLFIDNTIIANLQKNAEIYSDLISVIYTKASGNIAPKIVSKKENESDEMEMFEEIKKRKIITIPEPFNLTKPKPKVFKDPIQLVNQFTMKTKPRSDEYYHKLSLEKLEEQRKERLNIIKNSVIKKYEENKPFDLETDKRPTNTEKISEEVRKKFESELQFDNVYITQPKDYANIPASIKYNETAILREELIVQKEKKIERDRIERLLIDKGDTKEYDRWRREMEMKDDQLKFEEVMKSKSIIFKLFRKN
jgi:hypothetical protein